MLTSWIQGVSVLRNMCAHNSRIYNRTIHTTLEILDVDKITPPPTHNGLYSFEAEYTLKDWSKLSNPKVYDRILAK